MMNKEEINYILESLKFKTSIYRDKYKRNLSFNDDEYYANVLNEYIEDLQQKLDKILTYTKKQCDDYLKEDDCEYCDGVFASCRKVLQLAGEDISEYE